MTMKSYERNISVESVSDGELSCDEGMQEEFVDLLYQAAREDRCIQGVFQCAHVLENTPEIVRLCILPEEQCKNISAHIQQKLIEAYCWENGIDVVNMEEKVLQSLAKTNRTKETNKSSDFYCLLLTTAPFDADSIDVKASSFDDNFG